MIKRLSRLVAVMLLISGVSSVAAQELQVYYFPRPPLYIKAADGNPTGFLTEIAKLVLNETKVAYKLVEMPSARVEPSLKNRDYAVGLGWFKNPAREEWASFSEPVYQDLPNVVIVNKEKAGVLGAQTTMSGLMKSGLTLGVIDGFSYGAFADKAIADEKPKTEKVVGEQGTLVAMVARSRADYMILGLEEAGYLMENDPASAASLKVIKISDWPAGNFRYFMFSKVVDKTVIDKVNAAIAKVKTSENYKKLTDFSKYLK
ncbi:MAG: hypothetical protein A2Y38_00970 [Spirochaetes bacterium GWB1_59_5]|nr:MAG: hypothetical protein A2Y38_00970 [Spirochaetes bacterium GWB1_59_5]